MPDIFISYSRPDEPIARQFADRFIEAGLDVWWDSHLRSGEEWDRVIEQALRAAHAVVVLWSPDAVTSPWVRAEATAAHRQGSLVPTIIAPCELPLVFGMIQTADLGHWSGNTADPVWQGFLGDVIAMVEHNGGAARAAPQPTRTSAPTRIAGGERRQVTALCCRIELPPDAAEDPEDRIELVEAAHRVLGEAFAPFNAMLIDAPTENLTALFGMRRTREDDAIMAVDAALAGQEAIARLARECGHARQLCCGLRTGTVIVEGKDAKPLGGAIDEAQRLEMRARSGEILVCPVTANLVQGYFPLSQAETGSARVDGPHSAETRFELSRNRGLTGFVGREQELAALRDARIRAATGEGHVIGLVAEAGSGKSRLCHEFKQECRQGGMRVIESAARANAGSVPLLTVLGLFRSFFELRGTEQPAEARERIGQWIAENEPKLDAAQPLLFEFLSIAEEGTPPSGLDPQLRQRQLVGLLRHLVNLASRDAPALLLVEDLHWMDESSAQFLEQLVDGQARSRSLMLLNYRPEFRAPWMQASHCRQMALVPLGRAEIEALLAELIGTDPSVEPLHAPIMERTKGNPFFIEEIVRTLAETGQLTGEKGDYRFAGDAAGLSVPDTVRAVLAARIDRLQPQEKAVLQAASVIGKDFEESVLAEICGLAPTDLADALANLQRSEFIEETEIFPVSRHAFRHPLVVETAQASLLRKRRRDLNALVAQALERREASQLDEQAALIAHHWEEAGENSRAAGWYARAAQWITASDHSAAISNWQKVRALIGPAPGTPEEIGHALTANAQLLNLNFRVAVDLELGRQLLEEGTALADMVGDATLKLQQSMLFSRILCGSGDLPAYLANARVNLAAAEESGDARLTLVGKIMLIDACNYSCLYDEVIAIAKAGLEQYPRDLPREMWATGFNPYTFFIFMRGAALGWTGHYREMLDQFARTYLLANEDSTPEVVCWCLFLKSVFATANDDSETARAAITELREVSDTAGVPLNVAHRHLADADFAIHEHRYDDAIAAAGAARAFFTRLEKQWESFAMMLHARALLGKGELDAAEAMGLETSATAQGASVLQMAAAGLIVAADARLRRDGPAAVAAARAGLAEARSLVERSNAQVLLGGLERTESLLAHTESTAIARS